MTRNNSATFEDILKHRLYQGFLVWLVPAGWLIGLEARRWLDIPYR